MGQDKNTIVLKTVPRHFRTSPKHIGLSNSLQAYALVLLYSPLSALGDLLWADPDKDITGWAENDRGVSFIFGPDVVTKGFEVISWQTKPGL